MKQIELATKLCTLFWWQLDFNQIYSVRIQFIRRNFKVTEPGD